MRKLSKVHLIAVETTPEEWVQVLCEKGGAY